MRRWMLAGAGGALLFLAWFFWERAPDAVPAPGRGEDLAILPPPEDAEALAGPLGAEAPPAPQEDRAAPPRREGRPLSPDALAQALRGMSEAAAVLRAQARGQEPSSADEEAALLARREGIRNAIRGQLPGIQACYDDALTRNEQLGGRVSFTFTIHAKDGEGRVDEGEVAETELDSPFFEACVLQQLGAARFPSPPEGEVLEITYPFVFASVP